MNDVELLNRLLAAQQSYALDALKQPGGTSEFDYGVRVGVVQGYERAINMMLQMYDEAKSDKDDL